MPPVLTLTRSATRGAMLAVLWSVSPARAAPHELRTFIPNSFLRQGEVRVLETPEAVTLQTILYTRFPGRVIAAIVGKEEASWPPGSACRTDSQAYGRVLKAVPESIERERRAHGNRDGAYRWMIEFTAAPATARVEFAEIRTQGPRDQLAVTRTRPLPTPEVSEAYIRQNMAFILLDMFGSQPEHEPVVARLLQRLKEYE
jgi:hypothetical protein